MATPYEVHAGGIGVSYEFVAYPPPVRKVACEKLGEVVYLMESWVPIREANEIQRTVLPARTFHAVGGLVVEWMRHIPGKGEFTVEEGYRPTVVAASEQATVKLRVELESAAGQGDKSRQ